MAAANGRRFVGGARNACATPTARTQRKNPAISAKPTRPSSPNVSTYSECASRTNPPSLPCRAHQVSKPPGPMPRHGWVDSASDDDCQYWYRPLPLALSNRATVLRFPVGSPSCGFLNWSQRSESHPGAPAPTAPSARATRPTVRARAAVLGATVRKRGLAPWRAARLRPSWTSATPAQTASVIASRSSPCCRAAAFPRPLSSASRWVAATMRIAPPAPPSASERTFGSLSGTSNRKTRRPVPAATAPPREKVKNRVSAIAGSAAAARARPASVRADEATPSTSGSPSATSAASAFQ